MSRYKQNLRKRQLMQYYLEGLYWAGLMNDYNSKDCKTQSKKKAKKKEVSTHIYKICPATPLIEE